MKTHWLRFQGRVDSKNVSCLMKDIVCKDFKLINLPLSSVQVKYGEPTMKCNLLLSTQRVPNSSFSYTR